MIAIFRYSYDPYEGTEGVGTFIRRVRNVKALPDYKDERYHIYVAHDEVKGGAIYQLETVFTRLHDEMHGDYKHPFGEHRRVWRNRETGEEVKVFRVWYDGNQFPSLPPGMRIWREDEDDRNGLYDILVTDEEWNRRWKKRDKQREAAHIAKYGVPRPIGTLVGWG